MDENTAPEERDELTPIFGAYRRGYDPEKVDRYVEEQRRRLDAMTNRATEAERKLAAAVGQLRELHRRVAVLESEGRSSQSEKLDTLGERVQRILQEAWDGAFALRQGAEQEATETRQKATDEADEIVASARRKAEAVEEEIDRRRRAYLDRIEAERAKAASQMSYLHEQRKVALKELMRVKQLIEATIGEVSRPKSTDLGDNTDQEEQDRSKDAAFAERSYSDEELPATMPVHRLVGGTPRADEANSALVNRHRESLQQSDQGVETGPKDEDRVSDQQLARVFDFEREQPD